MQAVWPFFLAVLTLGPRGHRQVCVLGLLRVFKKVCVCAVYQNKDRGIEREKEKEEQCGRRQLCKLLGETRRAKGHYWLNEFLKRALVRGWEGQWACVCDCVESYRLLFYNTSPSILFLHCVRVYKTSSLLFRMDSIVSVLTGKPSLIALSHPFTINVGTGCRRTASGRE